MERYVNKVIEIMASKQKQAQMVRVAELYYERSMSQQEIAKIMGCSHSTVSRLLAEAHDTGIVEITIHRPVANNADLAAKLCKRFELRDVVVVLDSENAEQNLRNVGRAAAVFLLSMIENNSRIGVTWGNTLFHMVQALEPVGLENIEVIQISGTLGQGNAEIDGANLVIRLAEKLNASYRLMPAPTVVDDELIKEKLVQQAQIRQVFELAQSADVIFQGIGALEDSMSSLERAGYISEAERQAAHNLGAVGHVVGRMIDIHGNEVTNYNKRVIGLPLPELRKMKWSVGISASALKASAILGAIRGKYVNALVIEETSAREILRLADMVTA
jgi:deoxyribonucleoside regulator